MLFMWRGLMSCVVMQRAPHNNVLATPDYEEWKYFRKMTNIAFSPENIRKVTPSPKNQFVALMSTCLYSCNQRKYECKYAYWNTIHHDT